MEGVSGSAEGNPLLQVKEYLIIIQGADIILSPKYRQPHPLVFWTKAHILSFQTLQTKWKNLAVDWDGSLPSII